MQDQRFSYRSNRPLQHYCRESHHTIVEAEPALGIQNQGVIEANDDQSRAMGQTFQCTPDMLPHQRHRPILPMPVWRLMLVDVAEYLAS